VCQSVFCILGRDLNNFHSTPLQIAALGAGDDRLSERREGERWALWLGGIGRLGERDNVENL